MMRKLKRRHYLLSPKGSIFWDDEFRETLQYLGIGGAGEYYKSSWPR